MLSTSFSGYTCNWVSFAFLYLGIGLFVGAYHGPRFLYCFTSRDPCVARGQTEMFTIQSIDWWNDCVQPVARSLRSPSARARGNFDTDLHPVHDSPDPSSPSLTIQFRSITPPSPDLARLF